MNDDKPNHALVRRACCEILGRGERPSRPSVQALLATPAYLGRKGSNALVQGLINDFWVEMGESVRQPPRAAADVPDEFAAVLDRALVELVGVARGIAAGEMAAREEALAARADEIAAEILAARDAAQAADEKRLRAEREAAALQAQLAELNAALRSADERLAEAGRRNEALLATIAGKDAELGRQFAALEQAAQTQERLADEHRLELHRLMQQLDGERQAARSELLRLRAELDTARERIEAVRDDAAVRLAEERAAARSEIRRIGDALDAAQADSRADRHALDALRAEMQPLQTGKAIDAATISELRERLARAEHELRAAQQESAGLHVRIEAAERARQALAEIVRTQGSASAGREP